MIGPILGPVLGGYITEHLTWRWVFLINLPVGILAFIGILVFIKGEKGCVQRPFDFIGFGDSSKPQQPWCRRDGYFAPVLGASLTRRTRMALHCRF